MESIDIKLNSMIEPVIINKYRVYTIMEVTINGNKYRDVEKIEKVSSLSGSYYLFYFFDDFKRPLKLSVDEIKEFEIKELDING
jgi:hypothetical protein